MLKQVFIDCMPGPTNHFGGHAYGNLASMASKEQPINPRKAALEWLEKVKIVNELGAHQFILPPHRRPLSWNKNNSAWTDLSSGFIWMANAGHFFPAIDTQKQNHQFIPANMNKTKHRQKEHPFNQYWIKRITKELRINSHPPLRHNDEGAANTIRLWGDDHSAGVHVFIHGHTNSQFPSRQTRESIRELKELAQPKHSFILQQQKKAIESGVFHNDVISFGFRTFLFCHEEAFENQSKKLSELTQKFKKVTNKELHVIEVKKTALSLNECIQTYLFNSQVIIRNKKTILLCPIEVKRNKKSHLITNKWKKDGYFSDIEFTDIKSSLMNGGGPACLRLCIYLNESEIQKMDKRFHLSPPLIDKLHHYIITQYPTHSCIKNIQECPDKYRKITTHIEQIFLH